MEHAFIADTNLFFECKRLEELPWSDLAVDPIVIALTKPVLAEIDKHKKGGGRTRKRAIEISMRIRGMLKDHQPEDVIQERGPRVLLRLMSIVQPDPTLANSLDYNTNDDRIVGNVSALLKGRGFTSVSLLTDDSVAASTAHSLGLSFFMIPEGWKRPPEETTEAKRIKELERDISIYRAQEPAITIQDSSGDTTRAHVVRRVALALGSIEIEQLIEKLQTRHPLMEDFDAPETEIHADGTVISYEGPDAGMIEKYKFEAYPKWVKACRCVFETLHEGRVEPEPRISLTFSVTNSGTRPATKMRVSFEASGNIHLSRGPYDPSDDDHDKVVEQSAPPSLPKLPTPPVAPEVRRNVKRPNPVSKGIEIATLRASGLGLRLSDLEKGSRGVLGDFNSHYSAINDARSMFGNIPGTEALADFASSVGPISDLMRMAQGHDSLGRSLFESGNIARSIYLDMPAIRLPPMPKKENPEEFYYDRWPPRTPTKRGALTCELFRHKRGEELFEVNVVFPNDGDTTGAVRCIVEAENLTKPVTLLMPVSRTIETFSLVAIAEEMVECCGL